MAARHQQLDEVADETGWTRAQVAHLLNAGLSTTTKWSTNSGFVA
ncbi:hypothetical protein Q5425_43990 [Amycolatopsis sp. A133]|nr:hypothetical protein [Amycolatopsis sp. A133]MDQ7810729.1 hypothetical protein [Amycolatopsis sp. A133]